MTILGKHIVAFVLLFKLKRNLKHNLKQKNFVTEDKILK